MKYTRPLLAFLLAGFCQAAFAQTVPVGAPVVEEALRRQQLAGEGDTVSSFAVRPVRFTSSADYDTLMGRLLPQSRRQGRFSFARGKGTAAILPFTFQQQYNTHHPYGWNDGSMIPARGYQNRLSAGVHATLGPLQVQVQPELVYAQNRDFPTFPASHSDEVWRDYYGNVLNRIDDPEKYGDGRYTRFFPGQSSVRINVKKFSIGVSTENLWWGPGIRNSLLMSNNAPGFPRLTLNTTAPVLSPVGSFEGQIVSGLLKSSGILPADTSRTYNGLRQYEPKPAGDRYLNGMILTWQPRWTKGLYLGFSRALYQYRSDVHTAGDYLPVVAKLFKKDYLREDSIRRDQLLSVFFRLVLPKEKAEPYAEFGRNDHASNARDLLLEPEHARGFIIGGRKLFAAKKDRDVELFLEVTQLQNAATATVRQFPVWYTHHQVRHGYTHLGQVIGAGIGPGGSSQTLALNWIKDAGIRTFGVSLERVVRNNDFFYAAIRNYQLHWVDVSANVFKSWRHKNLLYTADLSLVRSYNYQWRNERNAITEGKKFSDVTNLHARLSVSYLF